METEVTNISSHGIWVYSNEKEFFLSYDNFPWYFGHKEKYQDGRM